MIRFALEDDIKRIRKLWDAVFYEEHDFNDYFFEKIFDFRNTLIMTEGNELLSMVQMLPCEIKGIGKATYIYGAATNPDYRKRGLMTELLNASFEIDIKNNVKASVLIPADNPLFDFYEKTGYKTVFYVSSKKHIKGNVKITPRQAEYRDISLLSDIYSGDILRNEDYWKTQLDMYNTLGGKFFIYNNAYAIVSDCVEEIMYKNEEDKNSLLDFVCDYLKADYVEYTEKGDNTAFGMLRPHCEINTEKLYMNLMYN